MINERIKELRDEGQSWTEIGKIEARTTHADPRTEGVRLRSQYRRAYEPPYKRKNRQGRREEVVGNEESQSGASVAENNTGHTTQDTVQDTTQADGTVMREKTARLSNQQYTSEKTYSSPNTKPSSPEELLASHGYDPSKWTIVS